MFNFLIAPARPTPNNLRRDAPSESHHRRARRRRAFSIAIAVSIGIGMSSSTSAATLIDRPAPAPRHPLKFGYPSPHLDSTLRLPRALPPQDTADGARLVLGSGGSVTSLLIYPSIRVWCRLDVFRAPTPSLYLTVCNGIHFLSSIEYVCQKICI